MGNTIRSLSDSVCWIAADDTWIEGNAIQQLQTTSQLPGMARVAGMPDLHPGRGYPVGAAFFSTTGLYPALVGNDIGCGMGLWRTDLVVNRLKLDKLDRQLGNLDGPLDDDWTESIIQLGLGQHPHRRSLGTLGGGNHFAELQRLDTIYDDSAIATLGLTSQQALLLVHSGSRGFGEAILRRHVDQHGHRALLNDTAELSDYLSQHQQALHYAHGNRELIARRILARLRTQGAAVLDVDHNFVTAARIEGVDGWLHRKGATPSDAGIVVIPGSRGDYSYLVQPIQQAINADRCLYSLAHGAGRKWQRADCKGRLQRFRPAEFLRTDLGSRVICEDKSLIYEEAPQAYKAIDSVVLALQAAGLINLLARLRPLLTYKTRGECCE